MNVSIVGAAAIIDYILQVERLPVSGEVVKILGNGGIAQPYWGGCAPNIAAGLARLGVSASLIYPVGADFPGSLCEQYWQSLDLGLEYLCFQPDLPSGVAYLFFQLGGETMCFSALGAAGAAKPRPDVNLSETVVVSPVVGAFTSFYLQRAIREKRNVVAAGLVSQQLVDHLADIRLVVINQWEAERLGELACVKEIGLLARLYPRCCFYVTSGVNGSRVYQGEDQYSIPSITPEQFVDPTGAGDAYTTGVISAWLKGYDPEAAGYLGAACASFVIEAFGSQTNQPSFQMAIDRLERQAPEIVRRLERRTR